MDSTGPLDGGVHDKTGRYPYLPSPHFSGVRDTEIVSATASEDLGYRYGGHHRQNSIQNGYPTNLHGRAKDLETANFQRIPYSPESLPSDFRNSDSTHTGTKIGSASPNHRINNTAAFPAINDNSASQSYLSTSFTGDKEVNCNRLSPSRQVNPRNRFHPYSSEFSRSHPENTLNGNIGYNDGMLQGNLHQKELPRTITNEGDYVHGGPLGHGRSTDGHRDSGASWSSRPWLTSPSSDLQVPQYPSTYTAFSTSPHLEASYVTAPYGSATYLPDGGLSQRGSSPGQRHSARSHSLETLSSSPLPNGIHCPHCTQTFPTAEQYT
ncbi:hypothetical protein L873DRAFT_1673743 [Choiromyces venosus 120613-1]|uniref:Uncharacterized protein n=1 Tax=Choiromyces venosus 120613-1 TaxID=1336337 RepID=A0A3N4JZC8_9PEZI|nr:hypothetical protein L873DRAFT_1673743 [Choiromyces venosus 120613-1]